MLIACAALLDPSHRKEAFDAIKQLTAELDPMAAELRDLNKRADELADKIIRLERQRSDIERSANSNEGTSRARLKATASKKVMENIRAKHHERSEILANRPTEQLAIAQRNAEQAKRWREEFDSWHAGGRRMGVRYEWRDNDHSTIDVYETKIANKERDSTTQVAMYERAIADSIRAEKVCGKQLRDLEAGLFEPENMQIETNGKPTKPQDTYVGTMASNTY